MIMRNVLYFFFLSASIFTTDLSSQKLPAEYVNPMIGTGGTGHTFPGPTQPFGMVQLSPDTRIDGSWEGCSGYYYPDTLLHGFSHTHLSGTGCSDYGDILFMPSLENVSDPSKFKTKLDHEKEYASIGYYSIEINKNISVELTSTTRVGIQKYTTKENGKLRVLIDLKHRDQLIEGNINFLDSCSIDGFRKSAAWATEQELFFHSKFSKPYKIHKELFENKNRIYLIVEFELKKDESLIIKTALSPTSEKGALKNLLSEAPNWDFNFYRKEAFSNWNKELSKIEVYSMDENKKSIFYSSLYHCMIHPSVNMDVDSLYRGRDKKIHKATDFTYYSVFSLWDTFRAEHPLLTLIDETRTRDFLKTFLRQFIEGGKLPVWELSCNETDCMIGYHSVSVILDAIEKGIINTNLNDFFLACDKSAMSDERGLTGMKNKQFLAVEDDAESVSKSLEYAYDDWCIAQLAKKIGNKEKYNYYLKRSKSFLNLFDSSTGFMRPRKNGNWLSPFDPTEVNNHFTEANSWQYSFFVPHDLQTLITTHGGKDKFELKLDEMFSSSTKTNGRQQADITGLIGQYAHGNEPSHSISYLYNSVGRNDKTATLAQKIMNEFYKNDPDGLIGNEDCGQMSAWYVFSSLGFYPALPGSPIYHLGTSIFDSVKINTTNRKLSIKNNGLTKDAIYIADWEKDGIKQTRSYVSHEELQGEIKVNYKKINENFGKENKDYFVSEIKLDYIPSPIIKAENYSFEKSSQISIQPIGNYKTYYSIEPQKNNFKLYKKPFQVKSSTEIIAFSVNEKGEQSAYTSCQVYKKPNNWKIKLQNCAYNKQYTAGGNEGIIDGQFGSVNWRIGGWQGYQAQDFSVLIDLGKKQMVQTVGANFLQDTRSWILFPKNISVEISEDGKNFITVGSMSNEIADNNYEILTQKMQVNFERKNIKFIRINAKNYGKLPEWHQGFGGDAFIFVDEVWVK